MSKITVAPSLLIISMLYTALAAAVTNQERGIVNMEGTIIDSACAIDVGSQDQTIDMDIIPISKIVRDGEGNQRNFSIRLINCILERSKPGHAGWNNYQVTFDGAKDGNAFGVKGGAEGIALTITDSSGNVALPGTAMPARELISDDLDLNYSLKLIGNRKTLRAGEYRTTIRFKMDYY